MEVDTSSESSRELRNMLVHGREVTDQLLARLEHDPDLVEVVGLLESLALVDDRRQRLLDELRKEASSLRRREEDKSVRQLVLRALDELGMPQTPGFLEDYLYGTQLVEVKSRGMGSLRRDEYRAWDRLRERPRLAYVVPCLDDRGDPVPSWMGRSDWPLARRIVVDGAEELWRLRGVAALAEAYRSAEGAARSLFVPMIERHAREAFGDEVVAPELAEDSIDGLASAVQSRESAVAGRVTESQERVAARLKDLDEGRLFWGLRPPGATGRERTARHADA
jgi:hypothetical protein